MAHILQSAPIHGARILGHQAREEQLRGSGETLQAAIPVVKGKGQKLTKEMVSKCEQVFLGDTCGREVAPTGIFRGLIGISQVASLTLNFKQ